MPPFSGKSKRLRAANGFLLLVGLVLVSLTVYLWHERRSHILSQLRLRTETKSRSYARETESRYNSVFHALERLASRGEPRTRSSTDEWEKDAALYIELLGLKNVSWVDGRLTVQQFVSSEEGPSHVNRSIDNVTTGPSELSLWVASETDAELRGFIVGTIEIAEIIKPVTAEMGDGYMLQLDREGRPVYSTENWAQPRAGYAVRQPIVFQNATVLSLTIAPTEAQLEAEVRNALQVLVFGLLISIVAVVALYLAQNFRTIARGSELRYRSLFEASLDAIMVLSPEGAFEDANPAATELLGYSLAELEQMKQEDVLPTAQEKVSDPPLSTSGDKGVEHLHIRAKGDRTIPVALTFSPVSEGGTLKHIVVIARDITEREKAERERQHALEEKTTLLQELYHRTKNNMQVIIGLIGMQAAQVQDPTTVTALTEIKSRVQSMALVHRKLYQSQDLSHVNLAEYIRELTDLLLESYQTEPDLITVAFELEPILVLIDTAVPCGLILNEVLSNALKHAFPDHRTGRIEIKLRQLDNGELMVQISDDGVGFPAGMEPRQCSTLGLQTIYGIGEYQLHGQVTCHNGSGVRWRLVFRDTHYQQRV